MSQQTRLDITDLRIMKLLSRDSRTPYRNIASGVGIMPDTDYTTCLNVPSIGLVVAGDAAYNDVHLYLVESNVNSRQEWIAALDKIETLNYLFPYSTCIYTCHINLCVYTLVIPNNQE